MSRILTAPAWWERVLTCPRRSCPRRNAGEGLQPESGEPVGGPRRDPARPGRRAPPRPGAAVSRSAPAPGGKGACHHARTGLRKCRILSVADPSSAPDGVQSPVPDDSESSLQPLRSAPRGRPRRPGTEAAPPDPRPARHEHRAGARTRAGRPCRRGAGRPGAFPGRGFPQGSGFSAEPGASAPEGAGRCPRVGRCLGRSEAGKGKPGPRGPGFRIAEAAGVRRGPGFPPPPRGPPS